MNHPTLFDAPKSRHRDPATSKRAAGKVWAGWPDRIIACLAEYGPASDDRICLRLNADPRRWPTIKTARSRIVHAKDPAMRLIVATDREENGQTVWAHRDFRSWVETVPTGDVL